MKKDYAFFAQFLLVKSASVTLLIFALHAKKGI